MSREAQYRGPGWDLHVGDCLDILPELPSGSAQCCVTSPPYWRLRDYGVPPSTWPAVTYSPMAGLPVRTAPAWTGCLGLEEDPHDYVAHLVHVLRLVRDLLPKDGVLWLNVGDTYASGSNGGGGAFMRMRKRRGWSEAPKGYRAPPDGLNRKDLVGIPWRVALALQADGWVLRSECIWSKGNPMPESVRDRPARAHEHLFLFSRSSIYAYDADAVRQPARSEDPRLRSDTRSLRTVWSHGVTRYRGSHTATMPTGVARTCILAGSQPGDVVLDPFAGALTTGVEALRLGRRFVGSEICSDSAAEGAKRLMDDAPLLNRAALPLVDSGRCR